MAGFLRKKLCVIFFCVILVVVASLLFCVAGLRNDVTLLENNLSDRNNFIDELNNEILRLNDEIDGLNGEIEDLNGSFNDVVVEKRIVEKSLERLGGDYVMLKNETDSLLNDISIYQAEIEDSLEWYKENSFLDDSYEQSRVVGEVKNSCVQTRGDECRIKLGCFYLLNSEKFDLEYKYDDSLYGREDKLVSLEEFLDNGGGDCEDYSLFFKAEYNYALDVCGERDVVLEGWMYPGVAGGGSKADYWLDFERGWYLEDVVEVEIGEYIFPNIICGNLFDPVIGDVSGHCMIAFTKNKIVSVEDLVELDGAYIIEPQDGSFQGNVNRLNSGVYLLDGDVLFNESVNSWIFSVITDDDYFLFSENNLRWESYFSFNSLLVQKKKDLSFLLE